MTKSQETLTLVKHKISIQADGKEEVQETLVLYGEKPVDKLVVQIHGFNTVGAWETLVIGNKIVERGYGAVLPSQMGFGGSAGERDYCGPKTVRAIVESISAIAEEWDISPENIVIWGFSRGAIITAIIATRYPSMAAAYVCQSGAYDFLKNHNDQDRPQVIKDNVIKETNGNPEAAARDRSPILDVQNIEKPLLLLHGDADQTIKVDQAYSFEKALQAAGKNYEMHIVPGGDHHISRQTSELTFDFIKRVFAREI